MKVYIHNAGVDYSTEVDGPIGTTLILGAINEGRRVVAIDWGKGIYKFDDKTTLKIPPIYHYCSFYKDRIVLHVINKGSRTDYEFKK
jgi:hypothetical protein